LVTIVKMPKRLLILPVALLALTAGSAIAAPLDEVPNVRATVVVPERARGPASGAAAPASVKVTKCSTSPTLSGRRLYVQAHMGAVTGTVTMQIRFHLFYTPSGGSERELVVPGRLGAWEPAVGVKSVRNWTFNKQVDSLPAPAKYRMDVDFQWNGTGSRVIKHQTLPSTSCSQPDIRPDLRISEASSRMMASGSLRYLVTVTNHGKGTAGPASLQLTIGASRYLPRDSHGRELKTGSLKVGKSQTLTINAPACPAAGLATLEVDPGNLIAEASVADNLLSISCDLESPTK